MDSRTTLFGELIVAFALLLATAVLLAVAGAVLIVPALETTTQRVFYIGLLLVADVAVFVIFGRYLLRSRLLLPLEQMIDGVAAVAEGDFGRRLPAGETVETARLADAVNRMTERLFAHRQQLAANVRSLEATNRELTEARDELIRAEKLSSVGRLAAGIAHEVGNPLGAIMGYLSLLGRGADPEKKELVTAAEVEARRIDRIVRGLLDFARPRDSKARPIDVNATIEQTVELVSTQGGLRDTRLDVDLAEALPSVVADPFQLQQILVNLFLNAADALDETTDPRLELRTTTIRFRPTVHVPARRHDDPPDVDYSHRRRFHRMPRVPRSDPFPAGATVVEITLADNGPGVPEELREQIFEPFVTTKEPGKGTGLGLAVVARLVDAMGGTIRVDDSAGGGAAFKVLLPAATSDDDADDGETRYPRTEVEER